MAVVVLIQGSSAAATSIIIITLIRTKPLTFPIFLVILAPALLNRSDLWLDVLFSFNFWSKTELIISSCVDNVLNCVMIGLVPFMMFLLCSFLRFGYNRISFHVPFFFE